ncbi:MAG: hypothetical protein AMXMBFR12_00030 [Candidatus Babeliales bacterium]
MKNFNRLLILFFVFSLKGMSFCEKTYLARFDGLVDAELTLMKEHQQAKKTLLEMLQEDQDLRRQALQAGHLYNTKEAEKLSKKHIVILQTIIEKFGWPSQEKFDEDCSFAAWTIAQHANHNIQFQKKALEYISDLNERFALIYWIFLTDRILANESKPQLYGTQYAKDGKLWPINDPDNLEARRKKMVLSSMDRYQDLMAQKFALIKPPSSALPLQ